MRTILVAALFAAIAWATPASAQLPSAADAKTGLDAAGAAAQQKAVEAQADPGQAAADAQKAADDAKATGGAKAEETRAAASAKAGEQKAGMKAKAAKKAREVKGKAKKKADDKAAKAGVLQPAAAGAVQTTDDKAEQKIESLTK